MSDEADWDDFEDLPGVSEKPAKGQAKPVKRVEKTPEQIAAAAEKERVEAEQIAAKTAARRTAQVANLMISGHSLDDIAASLGATPQEVESMLLKDSAAYVRTQPALRQWVRRYLSGKYTALLETVWPIATDASHLEMLPAQDRAVRILDRMAKLHGAEAPTQTEVKVDAAPATVQAVVDKIAAAQGLGYDVNIFDADVVDADDVDEMAVEAAGELAAAEQAVDNDESGGDL